MSSLEKSDPDFPFPFDFTLSDEELTHYADEDVRGLEEEEEEGLDTPWAYVAYEDLENETTSDRQSTVIDLAKIGNWPQYKTKWKIKCVMGLCTKVPVAYRRKCTKYAFVKISHPSGAEIVKDIKQCIAGAGLAAAITAVINGGAAGAAIFEAALKLCLEQKGKDWAKDISVKAGHRSKCGKWTPY